MLDKTFDPQAVEQSLYKEWEASGAFAADPARNVKSFTIMMPPPNVTGSLHVGHALNNTLHDIVVRYQPSHFERPSRNLFRHARPK